MLRFYVYFLQIWVLQQFLGMFLVPRLILVYIHIYEYKEKLFTVNLTGLDAQKKEE